MFMSALNVSKLLHLILVIERGNMLDANVKIVAQQIGEFYLRKNNGDYVKTEKELTDLRISKIEVNEKTVTITAAHVGLFIGRKGENIDNLVKYLKMQVKVIEDADSLYYALIPRKYEYYGV